MRPLILLLMLLLPVTAYSQNDADVTADGRYFHMPVNISLYVTQYRDYSLGRALGGGRTVVNYIGLNIFSGKVARLRGVEAGGLGNVLTEDMLGVMAAGVGNAVHGNGLGIQTAGVVNVVEGSFGFLQVGGVANVVEGKFYGGQASLIANVVGNDVIGIQLTGIANVVEGDFTGLRSSLVANVTNGDTKALQAAGIANVTNGNTSALQVAGVTNVTNGNQHTIQAAGVANVANGNAKGIHLAGIANIGNANVNAVRLAGIANITNASFHGVQAAGIANVINGNGIGVNVSGIASVSNGSFRGAHVSGLASVVNGNMTGIQVSGLANVANGKMTGVQIGSINVSESGSVIPLGLFSVVGNAPSYYDYWVSETGFVNAGIRSGSESFHNLTFVGVQLNNPIRWSLGWGAGIHRQIDDDLYLDFEGSVQHINDDEFWTSKKNLLTKARLLVDWQLTKTVSLYAGPSYNYLLSKVNDGSDIAPWSQSDDYSDGTWKRSWIGFDLGLRTIQTDQDTGFSNVFNFISNIFGFMEL